MAQIVYGARALSDLTRLVNFLKQDETSNARAAIDAIVDAVQVLKRHPFIGRAVRAGLRELVISYGRTGYVAMYRVDARNRRVEILAVRYQREAGFA